MRSLFGVVLAGGSGKRLWPLSRQYKPKQLLTFTEKKTLLDITLDRIAPLVPVDCRYIVTTDFYADQLQSYLGTAIHNFINEPHARNTGPAMLLSAFLCAQQNPSAVIFFVPADHVITPQAAFTETMHTAIARAQNHDEIILLGIPPTYPSTAYGYIECAISEDFASVIRFHEKPAAEIAQTYVTQQSMLWNCGIFCARAEIFIQAFLEHAPQIYNAVQKYLAGDKDAYASIPALSFDVAVLEQAKNCVVMRAHFSWSDIGNLDTFLQMQQIHMQCKEKIICMNAEQNLVHSSKKLVALMHVSNLCIVETDDVLFIAPRSEAAGVGHIVDQLKAQGQHDCI